MQVSLNWLNELVDIKDIDVNQIAHELTMSGLEVEEIEEVKPKFTNIITAKIEKIDNHPNSDRLHLVTVNTGSALKTVVCGGQNIAIGQVIPYASVGSKVLDRKTGEMFELTPATIRGVESQGMLCSDDELGVADRNYQEEDGILILNRLFPNVGLGLNVEDVLGFEKDFILHTAPTANRGDQMSVIGIARELSALFNRPMKFEYAKGNDKKADFEVEIKDTDVCKYYSIGVLKNITIKPSPDWMQKRLLASGVRAINNVVDITNYVMLEYGTPLHAFDYDKLNGYLCVRRAQDGETLVTLDEVERKLSNDTVLIATKENPVCLGGVFGGANSEIDDNTKNLALEAAYFVSSANRKSSRSVGYKSDACSRFERGIDIEAVKPALFRAVELLEKYADATFEGSVETGVNKLEPIEITLRYAQLKRILGCEIETEKCLSILENLGFEILGKNDAACKVLVPSFRANDVTREVDLIEEISRINGYDKITPTLPSKSSTAEISLAERVINKVHNLMQSAGLNELQTSSLIGEGLLKQFNITYDESKAVRVECAASEEFSMLRQTLSASLLNCLKYNYDNGQKDFWGYEIGRTYLRVAESEEKNSGVKEALTLAGVITGNIQNSLWQNTGDVDFYTVKGIVDKVLEEFGVTRRIKFTLLADSPLAGTHKALHPYKTAVLMLLGKKPEVIGYYGEVHPELKDKMKFNQNAFLFKLDLDMLIGAVNESVVRYKKLPQFPEVQRDLAVIVPKTTNWDELKNVIKKGVDNKIFTGCEVFDVYEGEHVQEGFKSIAFRIGMQDANATLTDETIEAQMANVRAVLKKSLPDVSFRE
ncbi:MAG: phenylalanine--tRNA ligase subunit beta [Candidatus Gastranaerophilales bacterium]|nr:phenylalanine--tRNA ligase subunit beta [Candidatus Gastranaerophilales bacterium]MCM1073125.1 phenylalanine--tRNA ligase subunit beta [Bacteroides sp.]